MEHNMEKGPERIPTEQEVMEIVSGFIEGCTVERTLSDEQGLYLLEAKVPGGVPGETTMYEYMRKGRFPNQNQASETALHVTYYQDGDACGGEKVAVYSEETGEWTRV